MSFQQYTAKTLKTVYTAFFLIVYLAVALLVLTLVAAPTVIPHASCWLITCGIMFATSAFAHLLLHVTVLLYGKQLNQVKQQVAAAKIDVLQQKKRLKNRTSDLHQMQIEEMRQMYRFAELGQMGVTLLHDLANHLSALTLEIEGIQSKQRSEDIDRAREIIRYLENIVDDTRERLHTSPQHKTFNIVNEVSDVVNFLHFRAAKADVQLDWQPPAKVVKCTGDSARLCQVIAIIVSNAIDAYSYVKGGPIFSNRLVAITIEQSDKHVIIKVSDWGRGISKGARKLLFKPFRSTKKSGLGLGLFIAKQTIETHFAGSISLSDSQNHTEFAITLPRNEE